MRLVTPVTDPTHINVQASSSAAMTSAVAAVLASIPANNVVTALELGGASGGSRFNLIIEYAPTATNAGGISPANAALGIRFFTGTAHTPLDTVGAAAAAAAAAANPTFQLVDYTTVGSGTAAVFMGMLLYAPPGSVTPPGDPFGPAPLTQPAWYVNAATGDDGNAGATSLTALQTLAELYRRTSGRIFAVNTTVYLSGDFSDEALMLQVACLPGVQVVVRGEYTSSVSATVDAFTAYDGSTSTPGLLDGSGALDYTASVGKFARVTAGAAVGCSAPVLAPIAAGSFRPGLFQAVDYSTVSPAPADVFVIDTITTKVGSIQVTRTGAGGDYTTYTPQLLIRDLDVSPVSATVQDNNFGPSDAAGAGILLYRVIFSAGTVGNNWISGSGVHMLCVLNGSGSYLTVQQSELTLWGFASLDAVQLDACFVDVQDTMMLMQEGQLLVSGGLLRTEQGIGFMDTRVAYNAALLVDQGGQVNSGATGYIWGDSELCAYGIQVKSGSMVAFGVEPTVSGGTNDTIVGGTAKAYADIPYVEPANNAAIVANA